MKPIPLTSPSGDVLAYACGRCCRVFHPNQRLHYDTRPGAALQEAVARSEQGLLGASNCCSCMECKWELPEGTMFGQCASCQAAFERKTSAARKFLKAREAKVKQTLLQAKDKRIAVMLRDEMSDFVFYCPTWGEGRGLFLWNLANGVGRAGILSQQEAEHLLRLSEKAGGWWRHDDSIQAVVFVPMTEWLGMVTKDGVAS